MPNENIDPQADIDMKKELQRFALCENLGLPYQGPAVVLDEHGKQKISPEAVAWMVEGIKNLPKGSVDGARAAEHAIARRRRERAMAGPDEQRTGFQKYLDERIDELEAAAAKTAEKQV